MKAQQEVTEWELPCWFSLLCLIVLGFHHIISLISYSRSEHLKPPPACGLQGRFIVPPLPLGVDDPGLKTSLRSVLRLPCRDLITTASSAVMNVFLTSFIVSLLSERRNTSFY